MGGYLALTAEFLHQGLFSSIITLGTKFNWTPETAAAETRKLNAEKIREKVPAYALHLESNFGAMWVEVLKVTAMLMTQLGDNKILNDDLLPSIKLPVTILLGDKDSMVTSDESENFASKLPQGSFNILPETEHPFEKVNLDLIVPFII